MPDLAVTEFGADRIDIFADGGGEVRPGVPAADAAKLGDDLLGDRAFIESASPFSADPLKRGRQRRLGMAGIQRTSWLKAFFMNEARGVSGDLPELLKA